MQRVLKKYNKDALRSNVRNIKITYNIIKNQIEEDGFSIINNKSWGCWYLVETRFTKPGTSQGHFNVYEPLGKHSSESDLLINYLEERM